MLQLMFKKKFYQGYILPLIDNTIQYNTNFIYTVGNTKQYNISYE